MRNSVFWSHWRRPPSPVAVRAVDPRELLNGIYYHVRRGASWRMLPHDFSPWGTGHHYYRRWRLDGTWQRMEETLHRQVRQAAGRNPTPSAAIIDSRSIKTTDKGGRAAMIRASR